MTLTLFESILLFSAAIGSMLGYLAGSVSSAVIVCRLAGLPDPRTTGSNNPGATNVLRLGGRVPAALTLLGDALKGYVPVLLAGLLAERFLADSSAADRVAALVALAAILGHVFPVFFDFRGGKGVATAFGALLAIDATSGALAILVWLAFSLAFRRSSLAALVTFVLVPALLLYENERAGMAAFVVIAALLFWTHRANIRRLLDGTEPRIGDRQTTAGAAAKAPRPGHTAAGAVVATDTGAGGKAGTKGGSKRRSKLKSKRRGSGR